MEIVRVSKTPDPNGVLIENIGWVEKTKPGITILKNVEYLELIDDENLVGNDKTVSKSGDYTMVKRCSCEKHVVKPLETLETIAKKSNLSVEYIIKTNSLKTTNLFIGQILKL